jgi:phosphate transport system substrate-binding protein
MYMLTNLLAQRYMRAHPDVTIHTEGGGSGSGIAALIDGEVDICAASRTLTHDETEQIAEKYQSVGMTHRIALDALCFYTNIDNPVKSLSLDQVRSIFSCDVTRWEDFGGNTAKIHTVIRPKVSGTRKYFENMILEGDNICPTATVRSTTDSVIFEVFADVDAIGYGGYGYHQYVNYLEVDGVEPSLENVKNHKYPVVRYLYFYTINKPEGDAKQFIEWVMSSQGQKIIQQAGYIPLF